MSPAALPVVAVQNGAGATVKLPEVFLSPIRPDIVNAVHTGTRSSFLHNLNETQSMTAVVLDSTSERSFSVL